MKNYFHSGKLLLLALPLGIMPDALSANNFPSVSTSYVVQQTLKVSGIVTDSEGEPLTGATVRIEGTTTGAMSGIDGEYALNAKEGDMIVVSYIGYKTVKVKVGNTPVLNFTLQPDVVTTEEVVVIGYGSQKKVNLTGAVASINTDEIKSRPQTNVVSALQGLVPGVTIINRPGASPSVNFRGRGNLGTSEPLYVVDGVIVDAGFFSSIDPNVIENISFLKDAASSSIYGSRAAYGVVLVTTKNGSKGTTQVTYNGMVGAKKFTYTPEYVNSWEYAELFNEAMYNTTPSKGKFQKYTQDQINLFRDGSQPDLYPNTDWVDLIYDKYAVTTQHSLNLTGGTDKLSFFSGFGIVYDDNNLPGRDNTRYNMNINVKSEMNKWLTFRTGMKFIYSKYNVDGGSPSTDNMMIVPSTFVAQHSNGQWGSVESGQAASNTFVNNNPLRALSNRDWRRDKSTKGIYEAALDITPIERLIITAQGAYSNNDFKNKNFQGTRDEVPSFLTEGAVMPNSGNSQNYMYMNWGETSQEAYTATARYNFDKGVHSFAAMAGTSYEIFKSQKLNAQRDGFPTDGMTDMSGGASSGPSYKNSSESFEYKMMSYFARVNYSIKDRYLLEANMRADGSSRFHKDNRWGYFPSFSGGWRISEESFVEDCRDWMNNLKLRASYGSLGNINNVGYYDYFSNYGSVGYYPMGDLIGNSITESKPANPNLGWEKVTMTNFGVDFDFFNNRLSGTVEYYIKNTNDILLAYPVPTETGIGTNPSQNLGRVRNNGLEITLNHRNNIGDFTYSVGGNLTWNKNKITKLAAGDIIQNVSGHGVGKFILREGEAIGSFYGFKTDGLYTQEDIDNGEYYKYGTVTPNAGDIKFVPNRDIKYGEAITNDDRVILGQDVPKFTYGLNFNVGYKNFELTMNGQGVTGTKVAFEVYQMHPFFHGQDNPRKFHMNRWTEENPNANAIYPRIYMASDPHTAYNRTFSDYHLFDADYFRIKNLTLAYLVPNAVTKNLGLSNLRVYVTGENLFTIRADKKIKDFDPETAGGVISAYGTKTFAFGVNVSF